MDNTQAKGVVTLSYSWIAQETEISWMGNTVFFVEIDLT